MGDFVLRSVRIHDNGDNVFNPSQDTLFNLDGNPLPASSQDVQVLLNELGVSSLQDLRGANLPALSRYHHFIAMGGRYLQRNQFDEASFFFSRAAELGTAMHLPSDELFQALTRLFVQAQVQNSFTQLRDIRQSNQHTFASLFLGIQILREMPESSPHLPQDMWNSEIKTEFAVFLDRELLAMLNSQISALENNTYTLLQVDQLWEVCRRVQDLYGSAMPPEINTRLNQARQSLLPLALAAGIRQSELMLSDTWVHAESLDWARQRLEFYSNEAQAFLQTAQAHPFWREVSVPFRNADSSIHEDLCLGLVSSQLQHAQRLTGALSQQVASVSSNGPASFNRVANMDESGSSYTGTVWYLRQIHSHPEHNPDDPNFPINERVRMIASHRLEVFRELRNLHLRIGTNDTFNIFVEGLDYGQQLTDGWRALFREKFPQGMPSDILSCNDNQLRFLYFTNPALLYHQIYPHVRLHGVEAIPVSSQDARAFARIPGLILDYREGNAVGAMSRFFLEQPGREVAFIYGAGHRPWDDFERIYRSSHFSMPQMRSVCWGNRELNEHTESRCPAFSE